jgi:hypothetical protein
MGYEFESRSWRASPRNVSANGIHDDSRAQQLGFQGGFVTGVVLYEHIAAELMNQGLDWLSEGCVDLHFRRPVYDGEEVTFAVDAGAGAFSIHGDDGMGDRASGVFNVEHAPPEVPDGAAAPHPDAPLGDPSQVGLMMRIEQRLDPTRFDEIAALTAFPRDHEGRRLIPVGQWVNPIDLIYEYFGRSTTIHFAGKIWHHSPLYEDESFVTRGVITGFSERRGNRIVDFNAAVTAADGRPVATIEHSSVYQLARERREAEAT